MSTQATSGPELQALSILPTVQLTGSSTSVPLIVDETGSSQLSEVKIQLDRAIPLVEQEIAFVPHGYPPEVSVTTDIIDAFLPTTMNAFSPGIFFSLTNSGARVDSLRFGIAASGTYNILGVTLTDTNGNSSSYSTGDLAALGAQTSFNIVPDHAAPTITALALPTVAPVLPDNGTGASIALHLGVADPSGENAVTGAIHLAAPDGNTIDLTVPNLSRLANQPIGFSSGAVGDAYVTVTEAGTYRVTGVDTSDTSGNTAHYSISDLAGLGLPTSFTVVQQGDSANVPPTGFFALGGQGAGGAIQLNGNIGDYTLSRGNVDFFTYNVTSSGVGNFILTANNGSGVYSIGETIDTIRFQNGQYLALKDLPAYVSGSNALSIGADQNDLLFQSRASGYEGFRGGDGNDQLFINGNVGDYTARAANAMFFGDTYGTHGIELISRNGGATLFIDSSVETIHFQNGQYLAFNDVGGYVAAATSDPSDRLYLLAPDGLNAGSDVIDAGGFANTDNVVLLDGNASDFSLTRGREGSFILTGATGSFSIDEGTDLVQFGNGQFLSLHDLAAYVHGDATFTTGFARDDLLYVPPTGDHYVTGGSGTDNLYLNGNTGDYSLHSVGVAATVTHPAIQGYDLVAGNGSGTIYIDQSVEVVHFQNGQYLAFQDLPAYIH